MEGCTVLMESKLKSSKSNCAIKSAQRYSVEQGEEIAFLEDLQFTLTKFLSLIKKKQQTV